MDWRRSAGHPPRMALGSSWLANVSACRSDPPLAPAALTSKQPVLALLAAVMAFVVLVHVAFAVCCCCGVSGVAIGWAAAGIATARPFRPPPRPVMQIMPHSPQSRNSITVGGEPGVQSVAADLHTSPDAVRGGGLHGSGRSEGLAGRAWSAEVAAAAAVRVPLPLQLHAPLCHGSILHWSAYMHALHGHTDVQEVWRHFEHNAVACVCLRRTWGRHQRHHQTRALSRHVACPVGRRKLMPEQLAQMLLQLMWERRASHRGRCSHQQYAYHSKRRQHLRSTHLGNRRGGLT